MCRCLTLPQVPHTATEWPDLGVTNWLMAHVSRHKLYYCEHCGLWWSGEEQFAYLPGELPRPAGWQWTRWRREPLAEPDRDAGGEPRQKDVAYSRDEQIRDIVALWKQEMKRQGFR